MRLLIYGAGVIGSFYAALFSRAGYLGKQKVSAQLCWLILDYSRRISYNMNTARSLYGTQLTVPRLTPNDIPKVLQLILEYYPQRDRGIITDRVEACILTRQKSYEIWGN